MAGLIFEWDEDKAQRNLEKHGVGFGSALAVFEGPRRIERIDLRWNYGEERVQAIGMSKGCGDVIRLISARRANRNERKAYETVCL